MKKTAKIVLIFAALLFVSCSDVSIGLKPATVSFYSIHNRTSGDIAFYSSEFDNFFIEHLQYRSLMSDSKTCNPVTVLCAKGEVYVIFFYNGKYYKETSLAGSSVLNKEKWLLKTVHKINYYTFDLTEAYILSLPEVENAEIN